MAIAHTVNISRINLKEQAKSIASSETQKSSTWSSIKLVGVAWNFKMLKCGKIHCLPLNIEETPEETNDQVYDKLRYN
jgi:hypothetical protein